MEESNEVKLPCEDKIAFESKKQAETTALTSHYWYGSRPHAYRCRSCALWHLSTTSSD